MKQQNNVFILFIVATLSSAGFAQDMRDNALRSLFSDQKANRKGDAVMIYVMETSSASNDAKTSASRQGSVGLTNSGALATTTLPNTSVNLGTTNTFQGAGSTVTNGSMQAKISARIDSIMPNGNMILHGSRTIVVNGEEQVITISGIVRPSDIQSDNSVYSYNISDATISFQGSGIVSRAQEPGWLTKIFHWLF